LSCFAILTASFIDFAPVNGVILGQGSETRKNKENLEIGLTSTLQELTEYKIFIPGFIIKCKSCSSKIWYSLSEINNVVTCKGCSEINSFKAETPISYKLNHLIKNNIGMRGNKGIFAPDGNLTVIKTLIYLWNRSQHALDFLSPLDIYKSQNGSKPQMDLDIICLINGRLYIGEAKHSSPLFFETSNKSLNNLLTIASTMKPDHIILSCTTDTNGRLNKASKYLQHHIAKWEYQPEIVTYICREPDYFNINGYRYFYH
jgi:hypothetical protein